MAEAKTSTFTIHHDRCNPAEWKPRDVLALNDFIQTGDIRYAARLSALGLQLVLSEHHVPKGGELQEVGFAEFNPKYSQIEAVSDDISEVVDEDAAIVEVTRIYRGPVEYGVRILEGDGDGGIAGSFYEFKPSRAEAEAYLKDMEDEPAQSESV